MTYDVLNRMVRHEAPAITQGSELEVNRFRYDGMSNLLSATNDNARVTRTYYRNGQLRTDSSRIRTDVRSHVDTLWTGYTAYTYGLGYRYDRNGRRTAVVYPSNLLATPNLAGLRDRVRYGYHPATGELAWVEGLGANTRFDYRYDARGRPDTTYMPGNITEWYTYDQASRRTHRHATMPTGGGMPGGYLRADTLGYDHRNKLLGGNGRVTNEFVAASFTYDGLGHLVSSFRTPSTTTEQWRVDPLGNQTFSQQTNGDILPRWDHTIQPGTGRLTLRMTPISDSLKTADTISYYYDPKGNRTSVQERGKAVPNPHYIPSEPPLLQRIVETLSMYRGDGVMFEFRRLSSLQLGAPVRLKEIYAYDALGRRVWRRSRAGYSLGDSLARDSICNRSVPSSECASMAERTIWDGDQVIGERRDYISSGNMGGWETHYGRVAYAHAGGIDQPTEIVRFNGGAPDFAVIPHRNWQGAVDVVTFTGARHKECGPHNWQEWRSICYPVDLPLRTAYGEPPLSNRDDVDPGRASWMGSVVDDSRDPSGLMYRRNRYLDPKSGQFTQPDPIGLAGGLNLYGYANGDPVSYSDPYGLCPPAPCDDSPENSPAGLLAQGRLLWNGLRTLAANLPVIGDGNDISTVVSGRDVIAGENVGPGGRILAGAGIISPVGSGGAFRGIADAIGRGHAYLSHVVRRGEFRALGIRTQSQFTAHVQNVMNNARGADVRQLSRGRTAYWDSGSGTVVIHDPRSADQGTAFRPTGGRRYFAGLK
jgi:RHS repeat-associated protein